VTEAEDSSASKRTDFLLRQAEQVRAEIQYKMQLAHRLMLAMLVAPTAVLPAMATLAGQIATSAAGDKGLGSETALFADVLTAVAVCLPLLLLWAQFFTQSQVNGILRAGDWLKALEASLGAGSGSPPGWESWLSAPGRRSTDDDIFGYLLRMLGILYYATSAFIAAVLVRDWLQAEFGPGWPGSIAAASILASSVQFYSIIAFFAFVYAGFELYRRRAKYDPAASGAAAADESGKRVERAILDAARLSWRPAQGTLRHPYVVSSLGAAPATDADPLRIWGETARVLGVYEELYDWDGIFCGGALLDEGAPLGALLSDVLLNLLDGCRHDGFVPRTRTVGGSDIDPHELCKPLLAQAALAITRRRGDQAWLAGDAFDALCAFVEFWLRERRGPSGLYMWRSALESGVDNNAALVHYPPFSVESVDATSYVARECMALAALAGERGGAALARRLHSRAADARRALIEASWDQAAGFFWNRHIETGFPIKIRSWTGLLPLWAGLLPQATADRLIDANLRPNGPFLRPYGIATLSRDDVAFNLARRAHIWDHTKQKRGEVSNWQGPVWVLPNALVADGLIGAGRSDLALTLCRRTMAMLDADLAASKALHECYDPQDGTPLWASGFVSWNTLALGMGRWMAGRSSAILPEGLSSASFDWR
jgi:putative isomerase